MYIGAVAVLPTYVLVGFWATARVPSHTVPFLVCRLLEESKSGKQALREVRRLVCRWCADAEGACHLLFAVCGDGI